MTRTDCENLILAKLWEIRGIINQYDPTIPGACMAIGTDNVWAFELAQDENGEAIQGEYLLNASERRDG